MSSAQKRLEDFGYKVETLTLSDGKYLESFTNDTLVQIGSVIFNKRTQKVVSFITYDTLYSEATLEPEIVSRFISPDPHAYKYEAWTPYNYAFNNPIFFNDPDGRDGRAHYEKGDGTKDNPHVVTISANFYFNTNGLSKSEIKALNKAVANFNGTVGKSGKSKDGTFTETRFALTAVGVDSDDAARNAAVKDVFQDENGETQLFGNVVKTHTGEGTEFGNSNGDFLSINRTKIAGAVAEGFNEGDILESTFNHEIGHNFGGIHGGKKLNDPSPMGKALRLYYTRPTNQLGGTGKPTVPDANVTNKFATTIMMRIGSPRGSFNGAQVGSVNYEKGRGKR